MLDSHAPLARHVTLALPPKSHVAVQVCPISLPAQLAGQEPLTRDAAGTAEQLVGGSAQQNKKDPQPPEQTNNGRRQPVCTTRYRPPPADGVIYLLLTDSPQGLSNLYP